MSLTEPATPATPPAAAAANTILRLREENRRLQQLLEESDNDFTRATALSTQRIEQAASTQKQLDLESQDLRARLREAIDAHDAAVSENSKASHSHKAQVAALQEELESFRRLYEELENNSTERLQTGKEKADLLEQ